MNICYEYRCARCGHAIKVEVPRPSGAIAVSVVKIDDATWNDWAYSKRVIFRSLSDFHEVFYHMSPKLKPYIPLPTREDLAWGMLGAVAYTSSNFFGSLTYGE